MTVDSFIFILPKFDIGMGVRIEACHLATAPFHCCAAVSAVLLADAPMTRNMRTVIEKLLAFV